MTCRSCEYHQLQRFKNGVVSEMCCRYPSHIKITNINYWCGEFKQKLKGKGETK